MECVRLAGNPVFVLEVSVVDGKRVVTQIDDLRSDTTAGHDSGDTSGEGAVE